MTPFSSNAGVSLQHERASTCVLSGESLHWRSQFGTSSMARLMTSAFGILYVLLSQAFFRARDIIAIRAHLIDRCRFPWLKLQEQSSMVYIMSPAPGFGIPTRTSRTSHGILRPLCSLLINTLVAMGDLQTMVRIELSTHKTSSTRHYTFLEFFFHGDLTIVVAFSKCGVPKSGGV